MSTEFHQVEFGGGAIRRPARSRPEEPRSDAVLVPLDQWNRILGQLGNLHEAGQQLADARERMARAETENIFLKERLRELRDRVTELEHPSTAEPEPEPELEPEPDPDREAAPDRARRRLILEMRLPRLPRRRR